MQNMIMLSVFEIVQSLSSPFTMQEKGCGVREKTRLGLYLKKID